MLARAHFLKISVAAGAGFALGMQLPQKDGAFAVADAGGDFRPNAWLRMHGNGIVTVVVNKAEMGQGVQTSLPIMVAEELDVPMSMVRTEFAPADDAYIDPAWGDMVTGGSTSVPDMYTILRTAGASARAMLIAAAAKTAGAEASDFTTANGLVKQTSTGKTFEYGSLSALAATMTVPTDVKLKSPDQFKLIGTRQPRLDIKLKVNGTAVYGLDVHIPGMKYASIERPPSIGGKVVSFDASSALKVKGVRQVVQVPSGIAVIGDHTYAALQGRKALHVTWDQGPNKNVSSESIHAAQVALAAKPGIVQKQVGDSAAALGGAKVITALYEAPYLAHATMEPMNATARVTADACEIWAPNQVPRRAQATAAKITGLPVSAVTVHSTFLGGGFGRRLEDDYVADAVAVSKAAKIPVKVVWSREDDIKHDVFRSGGVNALRGAVDAQGAIVGFEHRVVASSVTARWAPVFIKNGQDGYAVEGATTMPYDIKHLTVDFHPLDTGIPVGYWRAPGANVNTFAAESFVDELAHAAGKDPVAFRAAMLPEGSRARTVLDLAASRAGWSTKPPSGRARGVAMVVWAGSTAAVIAEVSMPKPGQIIVHKLTCAADCGQPVNMDGLEAQVMSAMNFGLSAALHGKITFAHGAVEQSNFDTYAVLRHSEAPAMDIAIVKSTEKPTGAGELGTPPVAAAVGNALFALTSKRYRKLPLSEATLA